jgi:hypothetical protein
LLLQAAHEVAFVADITLVKYPNFKQADGQADETAQDKQTPFNG